MHFLQPSASIDTVPRAKLGLASATGDSMRGWTEAGEVIRASHADPPSDPTSGVMCARKRSSTS